MTILVVAGVVVEHGRVLVSQRPEGSHLAGSWEFPGGKVEQDEDPRHALRRELEEELGIQVKVGEVLDVAFHAYPSKSVLLIFYLANRAPDSPGPRPIESAAVRWMAFGELDDELFPPADVKVLEKVRELIR